MKVKMIDHKGIDAEVTIDIARHTNKIRYTTTVLMEQYRKIESLTESVLYSITKPYFKQLSKTTGYKVISLKRSKDSTETIYLLIAIDKRGENYNLTVVSTLTTSSIFLPFRKVTLFNRIVIEKDYTSFVLQDMINSIKTSKVAA